MKYHETRIKVRFNEVDAYRVAWHGHYVAWMEVGRNELATMFGVDTEQLTAAGYLAPVVALELQYKRPLHCGEEARVQTALKRSEMAVLEFPCRILDHRGEVAATGRTVHVLTDLAGVTQYQIPPLLEERLGRLSAMLGG